MFGIFALVGAHAFLGEVGALCFLWALVEIINRSEASLARARIAGCLGVLFLFSSLIAVAYPYWVHYGPVTKSVITAGPMPWAHSLIMESKEHIAILIPVLGLCAAIAMFVARKEGTASPAYRYISIICALIVLMVLSLAGMGYTLSTAVVVTIGRGV